MPIELENDGGPAASAGTTREQELEAKIQRRTLWAGLFAFVALTELLVMVELIRHAS